MDVFVRRNIRDRKLIIVVDKNREGRAKITISDNAGGIEAEMKEKIFEPYTTTKHKSFGVGLGLYLSKIIIEEHMGGRLRVENGPEGAIFIIEI